MVRSQNLPAGSISILRSLPVLHDLFRGMSSTGQGEHLRVWVKVECASLDIFGLRPVAETRVAARAALLRVISDQLIAHLLRDTYRGGEDRIKEIVSRLIIWRLEIRSHHFIGKSFSREIAIPLTPERAQQ